MTERLLQYIWQFKYYHSSHFISTDGDPIQVIHPGLLNTGQGPDFSNAKIKAGNTIWVGSVELHIKSSDWQQHKHSLDPNYKNVILHVVWEHDQELLLPFPTIVLEDKVPIWRLKKYDEWMSATQFIPCGNSIASLPALILSSWKERLLAERLQEKAMGIIERLQSNHFHWEEVCWWLLANNFGMKVNSDAFEKIASTIPLSVLTKHKQSIHQVEALLLGQAGLLEENFKADYPLLLQREYRFLKKKYALPDIHIPVFFLRMRPANFPTVRLAQLAMLVHTSLHLFSKIITATALNEIRALLQVTANDFWHYHYQMEETTAFHPKKLGDGMVDTICINTIVPLLFTYGLYQNKQSYKEKAIAWLQHIKAEKNNITAGFLEMGISLHSAFDSQALLQLRKQYCQKKRCLECSVGNYLLKKPA